MSYDNNKRKRTANFSAEEKLRFLRILQLRGKIIYEKVTSHTSQTNNLKDKAWEEITMQLNSSGTIIRTVDNLKKLWAKLKTEAKVYKSKGKHQTCGTGGGPSTINDDPILDLVVEITGRGSTGIENVPDCDNEVYQPEVQLEPIYHEVIRIIEDEPEIIEIVGSNKVCEDVLEDTPVKHLKRRLPVITPKDSNQEYKRKILASKNHLEEAKLELIAFQKEQMAEQHKLKMEILQELLKKVKDESEVNYQTMKTVLNI